MPLKAISLSLIILIFTSCSRIQYEPDRPTSYIKTYYLAHKGGGYFDEGNTLAGCQRGLTLLDGIECDIQRSADNTLWLSHSPLVEKCGSYQNKCFAGLSDKTIIEIDSCLGNQFNYTRLEEVFAFMSTNYPKKFISLDVKAWQPCAIGSANIIN